MDDLCFLDTREFLEGLEFDQNTAMTKKINAVAGLKDLAPIVNRQGKLTMIWDATSYQFVFESFLVNGFKKTVTECAMNGHVRTDDVT